MIIVGILGLGLSHFASHDADIQSTETPIQPEVVPIPSSLQSDYHISSSFRGIMLLMICCFSDYNWFFIILFSSLASFLSPLPFPHIFWWLALLSLRCVQRAIFVNLFCRIVPSDCELWYCSVFSRLITFHPPTELHRWFNSRQQFLFPFSPPFPSFSLLLFFFLKELEKWVLNDTCPFLSNNKLFIRSKSLQWRLSAFSIPCSKKISWKIKKKSFFFLFRLLWKNENIHLSFGLSYHRQMERSVRISFWL